MPNHAYLRGRRLEWAIQRLFKDNACRCMRTAGSHGIADLILCRNGDWEDLMKPIHFDIVREILKDWTMINDHTKVPDSFVYGLQRFVGRKLEGEQKLYLTPASVWLIQAKTSKGK